MLTPADLDWVERRFSLTLPADYRAFLLNYNGGNPEPGHFRIPGRPYDPGYYELAVNFPSVWSAADPEIDWDFDLVWRLVHLDEYREVETRWKGTPHSNLMIVGLMPPADLDWICLGCRGNDLGRVYAMAGWLDDDSREERPLIAPSFAAFLDLLTDHDVPHIRAIKTGDIIAFRRWLDAGGDVNERTTVPRWSGTRWRMRSRRSCGNCWLAGHECGTVSTRTPRSPGTARLSSFCGRTRAGNSPHAVWVLAFGRLQVKDNVVRSPVNCRLYV